VLEWWVGVNGSTVSYCASGGAPATFAPARSKNACRSRGVITALLARTDIPWDAPIRRAIGVPEIAALVRGETSKPDAIAAGSLATRRYAKRQYTWLRHQPPAAWTRTEALNLPTRLQQFETILLK
jgi:tRNA dimethylallyltransferase